MKKKNTIAMALAASMLLPSNAMALAPSDFSDFPSDWSAPALEKALENGLLSGADGKINASGELTRAEMAAIMNRAFGASQTASLNGYTDVPQGAWYANDMAKAVKMGIFVGADGKLSPTDAITREEAFAVLARAFALPDGNVSSLDQFSDAGEVSSWAKASLAALVETGSVSGSNGKLNPKSSITRAEFAQVMSALISRYVDSSEDEIPTTVEGSMMIRTAGVSLNGVTINGDLILADGIGTGDINLEGCKITGRLIIRGGTVNMNNTTVSEGVTVANPNTTTGLSVKGGALSNVQVQSDLTLNGDVTAMTVSKKANVNVASGTVGTIYANAEGTSISGSGKVTSVNANANNVSVTNNGTKVTAGNGVSGVKAGDKTVSSGATETVGSTTTSGGSSGGSSGGGGGGSTVTVRSVSSWQELKQAVQDAKSGDTIRLTQNITDAGAETTVVDAVSSATLPMEAESGKYFTLDGNGYSITAAKDKTFCFLINTGDSNGTTTIKNLTVDGGKFSKKVGGAFFAENGKIVFDGCTFKNCNAGSTGAFNGGGAICLNKHGGMPDVTVRNCVFEGNYVGEAGATGRGGAIYANHVNRSPVTDATAVMKLTVDGCTFTDNKAAYGGAIAADGNVDLTVTNSTFSGNESTVGADDIYIFDGVSAGKKNKQIYSNVNAVLSGNTYGNTEDSDDMTKMSVIVGRYYPAGYVGTPINKVEGAKDLTFSDIERTKLAEDTDSIAMQPVEINGSTYYYGVAAYGANGLITNFTVNGQAVEAVRAGDTNVYYYGAETVAEQLYGTATLSYTDLYQADTEQTSVDAVSSATTRKYSMFEHTDKSDLVTEGDHIGYQIKGVNGVPVQVNGKLYVESKVLEAAGGLSGVYSTACKLENVSEKAPGWYKTLNADGTYGAITAAKPVQVNDATAALQTNSHWGDYLIAVTDPHNYLRNGRTGEWPVGANIQGIVVEATKDGKTMKVGLRHMKNIWVQTYEFAFDADELSELVGATIQRISYIVPENVYEYTFSDGIYIKPAYTNSVMGSFNDNHTTFMIEKAAQGLENASLNVTFSVPKSHGHGSDVYTLYSGEVPAEGTAVTLTRPDNWPEDTSNGTYSATITSSNYADITIALPMTSAQKEKLTALKNEAGALLTNYDEAAATSAAKILKAHYDEAVELLANADATAAAADELIGELPGLIQAVKEEQAGNTKTVAGTSTVTGFGYDAKVLVTYDAETGKILSVTDNETDTKNDMNKSFWSKLTSAFWSKFQGLDKNGVQALKMDPSGEKVDAVSGATYSSKAAKEAVLDALKDVPSQETEYVYCYAAVPYDEYWKSEGVYLSGDDWTASSDEADRTLTDRDGNVTGYEHDKGAFDAVSRATSNHGLHRGSFQQDVVIHTADRDYEPVYWVDGNNFVDKDGKTYNKTEIGIVNYNITGIKYVPVAVAKDDFEAFKAKYNVVENGGTLAGGYSEANLSAYTDLVADVTKDTNGLKKVTKNSDGSFTFSARQTGTDSGIKDAALKTADTGIKAAAKDYSGSFGEMLRVDLDNTSDKTKYYGDLGSHMQTVVWKYYGDGDTVLATFGTKFAADDWMHKSMGIQLGLTDSLRFKLPEGKDGTGKWEITVYALGYADATYEVNVTADNLPKAVDPMTDEQKAKLTALKDEAKALLDAHGDIADSETAWKTLKEHYDEAVTLLANEKASKAEADELIGELPDLIAAVKNSGSSTQKFEAEATVESNDLGYVSGTYQAKVIVEYDPVSGRIVSVTDNSTDSGVNSGFWNTATSHFDRFADKNSAEVDGVDIISGATVSMDAVKRAVKSVLPSSGGEDTSIASPSIKAADFRMQYLYAATDAAELSVSAEDGCTVYYTTDGTNPTTGSPSAKNGLIYVPADGNKDQTVTVKAAAEKDGKLSPVTTQTIEFVEIPEAEAGQKVYEGTATCPGAAGAPYDVKVKVTTLNGVIQSIADKGTAPSDIRDQAYWGMVYRADNTGKDISGKLSGKTLADLLSAKTTPSNSDYNTDAVSSATISSNAVKYASIAALRSAPVSEDADTKVTAPEVYQNPWYYPVLPATSTSYVSVTLNNVDDLTVRYTTDGSDPTATSTEAEKWFSTTIRVDCPDEDGAVVPLKMAAFDAKGNRSSVVTEWIVFVKPLTREADGSTDNFYQYGDFDGTSGDVTATVTVTSQYSYSAYYFVQKIELDSASAEKYADFLPELLAQVYLKQSADIDLLNGYDEADQKAVLSAIQAALDKAQEKDAQISSMAADDAEEEAVSKTIDAPEETISSVTVEPTAEALSEALEALEDAIAEEAE